MAEIKENKVNPCCDNPENLKKIITDENRGRNDITIEQCQVCERKHRTFRVDAGFLKAIFR